MYSRYLSFIYDSSFFEVLFFCAEIRIGISLEGVFVTNFGPKKANDRIKAW